MSAITCHYNTTTEKSIIHYKRRDNASNTDTVKRSGFTKTQTDSSEGKEHVYTERERERERDRQRERERERES